MKVLVIGSGGREHALVWKLAQSPRVDRVYCAPGNAGTARLGRNVPMKTDDHSALLAFAVEEQIDLTVVGPDDALAGGIVDRFKRNGLRIFGPTQAAAQLESSKIHAKQFMQRHGIPTAKFEHFVRCEDALFYCATARYPLVIKADGLALGKGVVIVQTPEEASAAVKRIMEQGQFGDAGKRLVIEELLYGEECSIHALVDGKSFLMFPPAHDYKRQLDGNLGPNTGGMGSYSPPKTLTAELEKRVRREILVPLVAGLQADGTDYRGMLYPGLILTADGPKVLEFNCRFGDPETQVLLPRLESDLLELIEATIDGTLAQATPRWSKNAAVCVVLASAGYPGPHENGKPITGIERFLTNKDVLLFHAGTRRDDSSLLTNGGRVLGVTALGADITLAREKCYAAVKQIHFHGSQFRRDIAQSAASA